MTNEEFEWIKANYLDTASEFVRDALNLAFEKTPGPKHAVIGLLSAAKFICENVLSRKGTFDDYVAIVRRLEVTAVTRETVT